MIRELEAKWRLYQLNTGIAEIERAYDQDRREAKKENKSSEVLYRMGEDEHHEKRLYFEEIDQIKSQMLCAQANRLDVPIPQGDHSWYQSNIIGGRALTAEGFAELRAAVRKEQNERWSYWELRLKVLGAILTATTGVAGALIGLVAIWKK
jgi:hypothetical protein